MIAQQPSKSPNRFRVSHIAAPRATDPGARRSLRSLQLPIRLNKLSTGIRHQLRLTLLLSLASNAYLGRKLLLAPDSETATLPRRTNRSAGHPRRELLLVTLPRPRPKIRTPTIHQLFPHLTSTCGHTQISSVQPPTAADEDPKRTSEPAETRPRLDPDGQPPDREMARLKVGPFLISICD